MHREFSQIITNENLDEEHYLMRVHAPRIAPSWIPGQFVNVLPPVEPGKPPILRRPISILGNEGEYIEFAYKVIGSGTKILSKLKSGQILDLIGPLGNGFMIPAEKSGNHILVCGGVGAPPIIALARLMASQRFNVTLYHGAKKRDELIFHETLKRENYKYVFATEDGSLGYEGLISGFLPTEMDGIAGIYACGPVGMLKSILKWRNESGIKYYVSVENKMGCGVGVCLGCSIPTIDGNYALTCKYGPVFDADIVDWSRF